MLTEMDSEPQCWQESLNKASGLLPPMSKLLLKLMMECLLI